MTITANGTRNRDERATETRIAAYLLTDYLERIGVEVIFGLCGHTIIALLDALGKSKIRFISTRHEQVAAHAADGYARVSGKPGVVLTHLGPGLTNAATGVANAALDSIPMVVIAGDVPSYFFGRHPHQEINLHQDGDQCQVYRPFCKRVYRVDRPADLPRAIERAFHLSQSGRPGPVLVDVPMDMFSADLPVDAFQQVPTPMNRPALDAGTAADIARALAEAERPVLYVGGGVLGAHASEELAAVVEALEVPVAHTLMGKGCLREDHPLLLGMTGFWGTPIANERCRTADLILAVGTRLAEASSSSWDPRFTFAAPPTRVMHIDIDPAEIGRNLPTELGVVADAKLALAAVAEAARGMRPRSRGTLRADIARERGAFAANWAEQWKSDQYPAPPRAHPERGAQGGPGERFHRHRRGLEQERRGPAVRHHGARDVHHPERPRHDGLRPGRRARREVRGARPPGHRAHRRRRVRRQRLGGRDGHGGEAARDLRRHGQRGIRHDCRPREHALRLTYGCMFQCDQKPYRVDYAAMARACGAEGVMIDSAAELGPALRKAMASRLPTVIQVPMENAPTPTPGHWDINDIYRKGE